MFKSSELVSPVSFPVVNKGSRAILVRSEWAITVLLALISALPTLALWNRASYLTGDSYQYLRAALTFSQGQGLRDMSGSAFTFFTPLYPLVIGIAHRLTPGVNIEITAVVAPTSETSRAVVSMFTPGVSRCAMPMTSG